MKQIIITIVCLFSVKGYAPIDTALDKRGEGDLCLILIDQVEEALAHIGAKVSRG